MECGTILYNGNSYYQGSWKNGKWHDSKGKYVRSDETEYVGNFSGGVMMGDDFYIHWKRANVRYHGSVKNNKLEGIGTMTYSDDTKIEGVWRDDKLDRTKDHVLKLKDDTIIAKNLFNPESGQLEGDGELIMGSCTYKGNWSNGKLNGKGILQQSDGGVYEGDFKNNVREGQGTYTWPDDQGIYTGPWVQGRRTGEDGKMIWKENGQETDTFVGSWKDGAIIKGTLTDAQKQTYAIDNTN